MSTTKNTFARKALASVGAAALGLMGVIGLSATAMADPTTADWPDGETKGTISIQKNDSDTEKTPLKGVTFSATLLGVPSGEDEKDCTAFDLTTQEGWVVANKAIEQYNKLFAESDPTPGHPGGPTVEAILAAAGACELDTVIALGPTNEEGRTPKAEAGIGLYLVREVSAGQNVIAAKAAPFILSVPYPTFANNGAVNWIYDAVGYAKNDVVAPDTPSKVVDKENVGQEWVAGANVEWTISVVVPASSTGYESIAIKDTSDAGLTFGEFTSVTIGESELLGTTDGGVFTLDEGSRDKVNAEAAKAAVAGDKGVTITARVITTVDDGYKGGSLNNKATLVINGKEGTSGGDDVTRWGVISVDKMDTYKNKLSGAEFAIYPADVSEEGTPSCATDAPGDAIKASADTDYTVWVANGGPNVGTTKAYCVLETKAPAGYVIDASPHLVPVTAGTTEVNAAYEFFNTKATGPTLPQTGASGTMLMTVGGIALVAVAGGLYMVTRRKADQK